MKLIIILLTTAIMQVSASTYAQSITLNKKNAPLIQVIDEIRNQSGYDFFYNLKLIKSAAPVTVNLKNETLESALAKVFSSQPLTYTVTTRDKAVILKEKEPSLLDRAKDFFAVPVDVHGRVTDSTGTPLVGANVRIKSTKIGVTTNSNGEFDFKNIEVGTVLEITYISYLSQEITITRENANGINITLKAAIGDLQEVTISTGYQTLPKERSTGSFAQIDNKKFNQQVSTDVLGRLEAITNSVIADRSTSGAGGRLMIRGLSTIRGPKDVLVVVDNFPYNGDINNINPNDVESVTILKDAAAASIWGARAGNGVIVITTKKGRLNQPLSVSFNANLTTGDKPNLNYIPQISSSDFIDVEQMLYSKGFYDSDITSPNKPALSPVVEILAKNNGVLSATDLAAINALRPLDIRDQFNKYLYRKSFNQQYALSLNGGTDKLAWISSVGYDKNISNLDADYNRYNVRFQNTYKPLRDLQLTTGIYYTQTKSGSGRPGYGSISTNSLRFLPYAQFADANGNSIAMIKDYRQSYITTVGNGKLLDWLYYPLEDYKHTTNTNAVTDMLANAGLNYKIITGLHAELKYQYERQQSLGKNLADEQSYLARNRVNSFTQITSAGQPIYKVPVGGILDISNTLLESNNLRGLMNYDNRWGKSELVGIVGMEVRRSHTTSDQNRYYGYNDNILTNGNVDYTTPYPNIISGTNSFIPGNAYIGDLRNNFVSTFGNAAYTYDNKYTISLSGRRDASNLFGLKTNDQWNPFWSVGAGWNLSNEKFYKFDWIPFLKLRATYGFSGNIDPSMVAVSTIAYNPSLSFYSNNIYANYSNYYNPELRWETSKMLNFGLDFKAAHNRISGSIEYYQKKGENLFGESLQDYTAGVGPAIVKNVASMSGNGIDIELNTLNANGAVKWSTTLNFSYYKDKVTDYYLGNLQGSNFVSSYNNVVISGLKDKPVYGIYAYRSAGLDPQTGDPRGYLNGEISKDYISLTSTGTQISDLKFFGSALPTKFGSFINNITYKNFSLNFSVLYKLGYYFRRSSINYNSLFTNWLGHSDFANRWKQPGDEQTTSIPSVTYPTTTSREAFYAGSEGLVEKGDHIRLQYVTVAYDLQKEQLRGWPFKSIQIYVNANNLGILWRANKMGIDPGYNGQYAIPLPKTYAFGIKGSF